LSDIKVKLANKSKEFNDFQESSIKQTIEIEDTIESLTITKDELVSVVDKLKIDNSNLESSKITQQIIIDDLLSDEEKLTAERNRLVGEISELKPTINELKDAKKALKDELKTMTDNYESKVSEYEAKLQSLEAQLRSQTQKIIEENADNNKIRENLANMQKSLDERDRNIRIREQKVTQSEGTILRNSNLLNL